MLNQFFLKQFAVCHNLDTRQRTKTHGIDFDCRVPVEAHGKPNGQANGSPGPPVCRVANVRHTANKPGCRKQTRLPCVRHGTRQTPTICRVFYFWRAFFSRHTANVLFAVCLLFAVCFSFGSRQMDWLPCVQNSAHGKDWGTRRSIGFR